MKIEELYNIYVKTYRVSTDTRTIEKGSIFFALKGGNFDGNKYAKEAVERGAAISVIDNKEYFIEGKTFYTEDVLLFLQKFAQYHRRKSNTTFIGITGSNGKTTTKELLYATLSKKYKTIATKGNLNNHIGVPLTILSVEPKYDMAVIEMGANHKDEISTLCKIAMPNYGYVTNFGKAHLGEFGGFDGVISAKSEMYEYLLSTSGTVFVNGKDKIQVDKTQNNKKHYLSDNVSLVKDINLLEVDNNGLLIKSQLIGDYNFDNLRSAISIAEYFGVEKNKIKEAIEEYKPKDNRSELRVVGSNKIILDAYNANPTSMLAALTTLDKSEYEYKVAILGDMMELGEYSLQEHKEVLDFLNKSTINKAYLIGSEFIKTMSDDFEMFDRVEDFILKHPLNKFEDSIILIKGSRSMALEKILK